MISGGILRFRRLANDLEVSYFSDVAQIRGQIYLRLLFAAIAEHHFDLNIFGPCFLKQGLWSVDDKTCVLIIIGNGDLK